MASLAHDGNSRFRVIVSLPDRRRAAIRLGKTTELRAEAARLHIESLALARFGGGEQPDPETKRWLAGISDKLHARLAKVGLVEPRKNQAATLAGFIDRYIEDRADVKESTRTVYRRFRRLMLLRFKAETRLDAITGAEIEAWRAGLARKGVGKKGLAENTIRRATGVGRQFFKVAIRRGLVRENPFEGLTATVRGNAARQRFVSQADIDKIIEAAPSAEWRLLIALARYGGLRIPSESNALTWDDVLWDKNRIRIHASKTERHVGGGVRYLPIFPELRAPLLEVFEQAEPGTVQVFQAHRAENLRTQFRRIITKAGIKPWPKPWQNLRSTRETELASEYPLHVVTAWIGNSRAVALAHYLQVTEGDYEKAARSVDAVGGESQVAQKAARTPAELGKLAGEAPVKTSDFPNDSTPYHSDTSCPLGEAGLEPARPYGQGILNPQRLPFRHTPHISATDRASGGDIDAWRRGRVRLHVLRSVKPVKHAHGAPAAGVRSSNVTAGHAPVQEPKPTAETGKPARYCKLAAHTPSSLSGCCGGSVRRRHGGAQSTDHTML